MGIVVSSRRASNIFWHGVTRLNAICVLISSLQRPRPLEKRGVRWFSVFHLCFVCGSLSLLLTTSPPPRHLLFLVVSPAFQGEFLPPDNRFCALVCHLVSRRRRIRRQADRRLTTCFIHTFLSGCLETQVFNTPACFEANEHLARWPQMNQLADVWVFFFFCLSSSLIAASSLFFFSPFIELGPTEHPDRCGVYLGQESSFMYMTPGQSRRTERVDEGRWWRTPTPRPLGSRTTLPSFPSHTFFLLHCNRLTNVPWKFTLDAGDEGSLKNKKIKKMEGGWGWKIVTCTFSEPGSLGWQSADAAGPSEANGNAVQREEVSLFSPGLAPFSLFCLPPLLSLHQQPLCRRFIPTMLTYRESHSPPSPDSPLPPPALLVPRISSSFSAAPLL